MMTPIKRLVFYKWDGTCHIGGYEYDGRLTRDNILGAFHTVGRTVWIGSSLWTIRNGVPQYRVEVETFWHDNGPWYKWLLEALRRD